MFIELDTTVVLSLNDTLTVNVVFPSFNPTNLPSSTLATSLSPTTYSISPSPILAGAPLFIKAFIDNKDKSMLSFTPISVIDDPNVTLSITGLSILSSISTT